MEHQALYRRFRPQNFDEVIGQEHIVTTLTNQIKNNQISHAYLFSGTRGTGKTSIAKIFAKAINCMEYSDGRICGKCPACMAKDNLDIFEIDAASNNGVDNIRDLKESIVYPPTVSKYKVYIIDEVHMLSESAFNALLKTLEEPPQYVVFILATTEIQKLPQTILSRLVRFDFRLVAPDVLEKHLKSILDTLNVRYEDSAVKLIASLGEGSVRDTLSIAESCIAFSNDNLTYESVLDVAGITSKEILADLTSYILDRDISKVLELLKDLSDKGKSFAQLNKDLVSYLRDLSIVKNCSNAANMLLLPEDIYKQMLNLSQRVDNPTIVKILSKLSSMEQEFRYTQDAKSLFEISVLSLMDETDKIEQLETKIKEMESKLIAGEYP